MTKAASAIEGRKLIWQRVHQELIQYAKPDSRFHYDFLAFTPDFRDSTSAVDRLIELPCYQSALTILVMPDNSLEELRYRALIDGKKLLVGTYRLRRGFILIDPARLSEHELRPASWLDGMERHGIGRHLSLAQMQEQGVNIDLCVIGGLVFNAQGVVIWEGHSLFEVQWALLHDIKAMKQGTPVVAVAHSCQVVEETEHGLEKITPEQTGEVQCDIVVTPDQVIKIQNAIKPTTEVQFDAVDPEALENIPPLQELKGIRMMEQIMKDGSFGKDNEDAGDRPLSAEEQAGIDMMEKIMKSVKA